LHQTDIGVTGQRERVARIRLDNQTDIGVSWRSANVIG
jgi:hypothetical protein